MKLDNREWKGKLSAGVIAGAGLALGAMGIAGLLCHTTGSPMTLSAQALLWQATFIWIVPVCACFLFPSGRRAWTGLGSSCVLVWLLFLILKNVMR
ncbi:hypothetical protein [Acetobacter sp.]|jgi:hypothetical protein|uniref:hypothetical protein n=1 Tax=Acetobacter sp. TaxID=440 RepID=UPI0025C2519E|nr:hypothetical protein [Acetobacter sp.]MCH4092520.1 hypothetical protein [Acetobacter sp.]MCI1299654.1 hypothetical protein [Acetobacter sp.]MCI1315466.1 hypothetical protein [Acetobacter sp.]